MDPESDAVVSCDSVGIQYLHDDMLLLLSKYLSEKDCLALAISGANKRFSELYGINRKRLVMSRCFFLIPKSLKMYFNKYINPLTITTLDASSCYWLPATLLSDCITKMSNLEELSIEDTKLSLIHLPRIFGACRKIIKLSFTIIERNLRQLERGVIGKQARNWMMKGFKRLTHLKIFPYDLNKYVYLEWWHVTLQILTWCENCVDVLIKVAHCFNRKRFQLDKTRTHQSIDEINGPGFNQELNSGILDMLNSNVYPRLGWMKNLKSFVVLGTCDDSFLDPDDSDDTWKRELLPWITKHLLDNLYKEGVDQPSNHFERLWISRKDGWADFSNLRYRPNTSPFKSLQLTTPEMFLRDLNGQFSSLHLEHLAHFDFRELGHKFLPNLKYIHGGPSIIDEDDQGLNEFLMRHPLLEYLHFDLTNIGWDMEEEQYFFGEGDWSLPCLKVLVYKCIIPSKKVIDYVIKACPKLEELHIGRRNDDFGREISLPRPSIPPIDFFSAIQFQHLTRFTIAGLNLTSGSFLPAIFKQCPKLECVHFSDDFKASTFIPLLAGCLPSARYLRDLKLHWKIGQNDAPHLLILLRALLKCSSSTLQRFVLHGYDRGTFIYDIDEYAELEDFILPFVKGMPHLVALCLIGLPIEPTELFKRRLNEEVLPLRPAFWYYQDDEYPEENDASVPRIHYDEIVYNFDPFYNPPPF